MFSLKAQVRYSDLPGALRSWRSMAAHPRARGTPAWTWVLGAVSGIAGLVGVLLSLSYFGLPWAVPCDPVCSHSRLISDFAQHVTSRRLRQDERRLVLQELAFNPVQAGAWLDLANIDSESREGRLTLAGHENLVRSYRFSPVDARAATARLAFAFEHWDQLTSESRQSALHELTVLDIAPQNRPRLKELGWKIQNPFGRVVYLLTIDNNA